LIESETENVPSNTPTTTLYTELQEAFEHFNTTLFERILGNRLRPCIITLQRKRRTLGYFYNKRFCNLENNDQVDEISLNPSYFAVQTIEESLATLVHEMVHQYQANFGNPGRRGYHNKEWGTLLKKVGLYPSNTGKPGGKEVGEQMHHYIIPDGPFAIACAELITASYKLSWLDRFPQFDGDEYEDPEVTEPAPEPWITIPAEQPMTESMGSPETNPGNDQETENGAGEGEGSGPTVSPALIPTPTTPPNRPTPPKPRIPAMQMPERFVLPSELTKERSSNTRHKYRCQKCGNQVWGKPGMQIFCGEATCGMIKMKEQEA